jgi:gliding motility-associated-like protein
LYGPVADFALAPSLICKGDAITFNIKDTTDVFTWHWDFGDGQDTTAVSPISHTYNVHPSGGTTNVTLVYWSQDSTCAQTQIYPVSIYQVISDFKRNNEITMADTAHCLGVRDTFINISTAANTYGWSFGDGTTSTLLSPAHQYTVAGTYDVELNIRDNVTGCVDTLIKKMYIYPPANGTAVGDSVCRGQNGQLSASGGTTFTWSPTADLSCVNCQNPTSSASTSQTYTVIVGDANGCRDTVTTPYYVQQPPPTQTWSTSIVIGQTAQLPGDAGTGYTYTWTPATDLSCTACPQPISSSTVDITYTETLADVMGCFTGQSTFFVEVKPLSSVDVPTAFTPNGDGTNDVVYVAGWGIKKLNYFKIFNRWGELVFETNDITVGWDGTYKGVPQNTETYVYEVSVVPYIDDKPLTKKGAIKLLR